MAKLMSSYAMWLTEDEEYHEKVLLEPHLRSQSEYTARSSAQAPLNPDSGSSSEDDDDQIGIDPQKKWPPKFQWTLPLPSAECSTHTFTAGRRGKNDSEAPHINGSFMPLRVFILYFTEIVKVLAVEINRYNHWCIDSLDEEPPPQPQVNDAEMPVYLAITIQMGHCLQDQVTHY